MQKIQMAQGDAMSLATCFPWDLQSHLGRALPVDGHESIGIFFLRRLYPSRLWKNVLRYPGWFTNSTSNSWCIWLFPCQWSKFLALVLACPQFGPGFVRVFLLLQLTDPFFSAAADEAAPPDSHWIPLSSFPRWRGHPGTAEKIPGSTVEPI